MSRLLPRSEVYVYEIDGYVAGFVGVDEGYIQGLFVDKDYRGQGLMQKLLTIFNTYIISPSFIKSSHVKQL